MSTAHNTFHLKRSRFAIMFQCLLLSLMGLLLFKTLSFILFLFFFCISIFCLYWHIRQPKLSFLQYLDELDWTLMLQGSSQIQRVKINKFINHHIYIVVYFDDYPCKSMVVWCDQLPLQQWKNLQTLVKLF